ncbi:MAG: 2-phosphosulfolactate phosphatase [Saprospiraceae bacterium]|nr:2-phosphosulfolactate phosphatase [Saprospiraceae bacterium]
MLEKQIKPMQLEVCLSPAMFHSYAKKENIVIVIDIFRATSAIATAFDNGVEKIIPAESLDEAREYKNKGYLIAAERDGIVLDFADFGNSPTNFMGEHLEGKTIVYSTTNGTQAINTASICDQVVIGAFINHSAVCSWLVEQNKDIIILCAGWKDRFSFEDSVYAGAMVETLLETGRFETICDSAIATQELWSNAKHDLMAYKEKFAHRHRLKKLHLDDIVEYCLSFDKINKVPVFKNGVITNINS